jgi:hypothetical protein
MNTSARAEILTSTTNPTAQLHSVPQAQAPEQVVAWYVVVVHRAWADGSKGAPFGRQVGPAESALIIRGMKAS